MNADINIINDIPLGVKLIAVSKTQAEQTILQAYNQGLRIFGENKPQELARKHEALPKDIEWHFIGHLQTNKVKYIAPFVSLIHAVDSEKLLAEINKQAEKSERIINCLVQVHIAQETTKFGFAPDDVLKFVDKENINKYPFVRIIGLMGMATFTDNEEQISNEFKSLKQLFDKVKSTVFADKPEFCELSMGMSEDYQIAIKEGSTMVRIGSLIFGERTY